MAQRPQRGMDSRRKKTILEKGQTFYATDTGMMWVGDGRVRGGMPAPARGHDDMARGAYDDMVVDANSVTGFAAASFGATAWLTSLRVLVATAAGGDFGYFGMQLPHGYVPGTDIHFHVHFTNSATITDGQTVIFTMTFSKAPIYGVFPAVATADATFTNNAAARDAIRAVSPASLSGTGIVANTHLIAGGATVSGSGMNLSSILYGRLERNSADTHASDVYLLSADAHIQKNRIGTEREYS